MSYPRFPLSRAFLLFLSVILAHTARATDDTLPVFSSRFCEPADKAVTAGTQRELIEDDWLRSVQPVLTTQADAAGACDGVKNGKYGFHVGFEANPWWQIDLGAEQQVAKVVVYNRLDYAPGLHNADALHVLYSVGGEEWTLCHDNKGRHFGGVSGAPPLEAVFGEEGLRTRFLRLTIPSGSPVFFHLDEVEVFAVGDETTNIALGRSAEQSSLSPWSTAKIEIPKVYPIASYIERGRRMAAELRAQGVDISLPLAELDGVAARLGGLRDGASEDVLRDLYLEVRWIVRGLVFNDPLLDFDRVLFVKRFTQETYPDVCLNHMPWVSKPGGDICVLESAAEGKGLWSVLANTSLKPPEEPVANVRSLLDAALGPGHVHGIDLWFDGDRVVFGYARATSAQPPDGWLDRTQSYRLRREVEPIHLYELRLENGWLRQLTFGEWSDLDPTYAPNGDIVFVSERCGTSLQCNEYDKDETSCNLYVLPANGGAIRRLSANKDGDYLPHCLNDGMIGYTRWEYHERSWAYIQSLWVMRPDGTGADALFKQHFVDPWALEDVRSIPQSNKLVAIAAGHHTLPVGPLVVINPSVGVNEPRGIGIVTPDINPPEGGMGGVPVAEGGVHDHDGFYGTPWALSEKSFLVSYTYGNTTTEPTGYGLYFVDVHGTKELIYRDPAISCFAPIPLRARPKPPVLPDSTNLAANFATCSVNTIAYGCEGIEPARVRYLRIAEPIGWPYDNENGGQRYGEDHRYGGPGAERKNLTNWTPVRILGDVPVQPDGSAYFRVPPDTAVYFQLLDEGRMELRRMRSFISFQPGESRSCVGCHESRAGAPLQAGRSAAEALRSEPAALIPAPWGERPISFLRDVQPVLDRHCTECHAGLDPAGGLDFTGGLISYDAEVPGYGHNRAFETILANNLVCLSPARAQDASITLPLAYGSHQSTLIAALDKGHHAEDVKLPEEDRLRLVMWIDANAPYHDRFVNKRPATPAYDVASDGMLRESLFRIHERRCTSCHAPEDITRLDWIDLTDPSSSRFLAAPFAQSDGEKTTCSQATYASADDEDYARAAGLVLSAALRAWAQPRRDLQALTRPAWSYAHRQAALP